MVFNRLEDSELAAHLVRNADRLKEWADCLCDLRNIQDMLADGKTICERRYGTLFEGSVILFGAATAYLPISSKDKSRPHQFGPNVLPGFFKRYALFAERKLDWTYAESGRGRYKEKSRIRDPR